MDGNFQSSLHVVRRAMIMAGLPLLFAGIHYGAYVLRFDAAPPPPFDAVLQESLGMFVLLKTAAFVWFGLHRGWGRFVTFHDLVVVVEATTVGTFLLVLTDFFMLTDAVVPRSVIVLDWGGTLIVVCGLRGLGRSIRERYMTLFHRETEARRVLIVGANQAGETLLRSIKYDGRIAYHVCGFVDDDVRNVGETIAGVPILGTLQRTSELALRHGIDEVLITTGEFPGPLVRRIVGDCRANNIRVSMLPSYEQLLSGRLAVSTREVAIDDLLRREPVSLDTAGIDQWLRGRTLMVTGSAGSIGSEVCRQLLHFAPARLVLVDRSENGQFHLERQIRELAPQLPVEVRIADISDRSRMERLFAELRPDILFHAAAYKHVPLMEANPGEAIKNNIVATRLLADLADEHGLGAFVLISTDKAVNPTSVMGACKRAAELYVRSLSERSTCRFVTVRFGNVLDSAGSVVPIFREQIARGGPVTVTDERMQRYFMTIPEAAQLVIQAGAMGQGGEIFVLEMGTPVRIVDLAADMIRLSGLEVGRDIEIEFTGLRPGEKLFEELHAPEEVHQPTRHPKIHVASHNSLLAADEIEVEIDLLTECVDRSADEIIATLRRLVPEYRAETIATSKPRLFHPEGGDRSTHPRAA